MLHSMTGFAAGTGAAEGWSWSWDLRSVNGRGLDMKLRLPDWIEGLEAAVRARMQGAATRGNITLGLRLARDPEMTRGGGINTEALAEMLARVRRIEGAAQEAGLVLGPVTATDILAMRGVQDLQMRGGEDHSALRDALLHDLSEMLRQFEASRAEEGARIGAHLRARLDEIGALTERAVALAQERAGGLRAQMEAALERALDARPDIDPARLEEELALIAVKIDVSEEIERLQTHLLAARTLLAAGGPAGRKLDFLTQEFNREANTLCAKAQHGPLTRTGLDLKYAIDQMREQVQNLE
ncbi:YicC/YloC family endoribonuclease [Profundibacterium mesophilum]|uniref:Gentisate 12-dioxygenase n=1 Tax=Profundibacterium mesophilum KAUST100406-0324 TaxID=1037889 RepID=A0A921TCE0_9RHOB|nr:YicC/YloC family endoribonuclease [Profundibacterium mesophilum]KAF0674772.1 gentisate 12-dioxygenase [Profundibacterium mesophilum KAUST100406-0324]